MQTQRQCGLKYGGRSPATLEKRSPINIHDLGLKPTRQSIANFMETLIQRHPAHWYSFIDFWSQGSPKRALRRSEPASLA